MKMYILLKEGLTNGHAALASAHGSLACYLKFKDNPDMIKWVNGIFKKCICVVNDLEFELAKKEDDYIVMTESSLNNQETAIVFKPREEYSKKFKFYRLFK